MIWGRGAAVSGLACISCLACGAPSVDAALVTYRERIEAVLDTPLPRSAVAESTTPRPRSAVAESRTPLPRSAVAKSSTPLPRRRLRRIATREQRIGPFDFLDTLGCPLSERLAARNAALGRVLVPTRRLAHELAVLREGEACLPNLRADRRERLARLLREKRLDLPAHLWNAVWLDEDLERFLSAGPTVWIGRSDPADAPTRLREAARAIADLGHDNGSPAIRDAQDGAANAPTAAVAQLEAAFAALRDDPAIGPDLRQLTAATETLARVTRLVEDQPVDECGRLQVQLVHAFEQSYLPLQPAMGALDRRLRRLLPELASLYEAARPDAAEPPEMTRFAAEVLGAGRAPDATERFRIQIVRHAEAWNPVLVRCGVIDAPAREWPDSSSPPRPFPEQAQ